jgi:hypothetical protein
MELHVDNQVVATAETRTPNLHRAKTSLQSADGRWDEFYMLFRSLLPTLSSPLASFSPQRPRSQSTQNGSRMCCAPCTSSHSRKLAVLLHHLWVSGEVYQLLRNSNRTALPAAPGRRNSGQSQPQMHISKEGDPI